MSEIEFYGFMFQFEKIDEIIEKFRATKNTSLENLLSLLAYTLPYKKQLYSREGLYAWACLHHDKKIFEGLE